MSILFVLLGLSGAFAEGLTLPQAVQEGIDHSPTVKKYQSAESAASGNRAIHLGELVPQVSLGAGHTFDAQYETVPVSLDGLVAAIPLVAPRTYFGAEATWTLFDGFGNINRFQSSVKRMDAAEQETQRKTFETRKKIELAYFAALAAVRFEEVARENVKTLKESYDQAKARLENGVSTEYDVLRVQVQLTDAETELEKTEDNVIIERKQLAATMGMPSDDRALVGDLPVPTASDKIKSLTVPSVNSRQDLVAIQLKSEAARKQANSAVGALIPSIGVSAQYEHYEMTDYPSEAYGGFRDAWSVGVFAKWSLFDGGVTLAKARVARAEADHAEQEYQEAILSLPSDFELWKRRYIYSAHAFEAKNQNLKSSQESFRIAGVSFSQGRKTITDVLDAENDLFRARAGVVQSQLDAEEALVKLELTLGSEF